MNYFSLFLIAALFSFALTWLVLKFCLAYGLALYPPRPRDLHLKPIPRLGGVAFLISFSVLLFWLIVANEFSFPAKYWWLVFGGLGIFSIGLLDDFKPLNFYLKLFIQLLAAFCVIFAGLKIEFLRLPNSVFYFGQWAELATILWVILVVNAINFLDGLDGLAGGVCLMAFLAIFFLSRHLLVNQFTVALLALIAAGGLAGFLPLNFNPAKIFLGDSGSYFLGYLLAVLAIISGGKVATTLLVLAVPIFDALWVIIRRLWLKKSPFQADRCHLHHRLLALGLNQRQAVFILYLMTFFLMLASTTTDSLKKIRFFEIIFIGMAFFAFLLTSLERFSKKWPRE